ncbi:MAG: carbohydrate-binding domain-containing protein [Paludibacteraceae bacterium]|nr:carbohydrate-binding domain-containing protein [Paludibacteraceae bacterium]
MKKIVSLLFAGMVSLAALAEQRMTIHSSTKGDVELSVFNYRDIQLADKMLVFEAKDTSVKTSSIKIQDVDSLTFNDPISSAFVQILFEGDTVEVVNPYKGVEVTVQGSNVNVVSKTDEYVTFYLKGTSLDGSLSITPSAKFALFIDNLILANMSGPAIKILEDFRANVIIADGSKNALVGLGDGVDYNAAFWSKTQLVFSPEVDADGVEIANGNKGTGYLGISSFAGHGIYSKDYVRVKTGELVISDVAGDGINTKDYFRMDGGSVKIQANGDAIDCNDHIFINAGKLSISSASDGVKALKCDSIIDILGGDVDITMTGKGAKALKNDSADVTIKNAKVRIVMNGGILREEGESSYVSAIKSEMNVRILDGADVDITCGSKTTGGKGINATLGIEIVNAKVVVEVDGLKDYEAESGGKVAGLKSDGNISIENSQVTIIAANLEESGVKAVNCANKEELFGKYTEQIER